MDEKTEQAKPEDGNSEQVAQRSMSATVGTFFLGGVAGAAGKQIVDGAVGKAKDVLRPKDDGPKVELPPGVERD
jgi:hypothetical protein